MARYTAVDALSVDMRWNLGGLWSGTVDTQNSNSTQMLVDVGGGFVEHLTGTGFAYSALGQLVGGSVTGMEEHEIFQGVDYTDVTISGFTIDAGQLLDWARTGNNAAALQAIFGGDDMITGSKGDEVIWLQEHLASFSPALPVNGTFGSVTAQTLAAFQQSRGLPPTGETDPATWQAVLGLPVTPVDWVAQAAAG